MPTIPTQLHAAIGERYAILRELGRGGMATVYLADDRKHGRRVAIKVLAPQVAESMGAERFLREIRLTARLDHPHILPLLDSGSADGVLYYVMPYVEGETLRQRIEREGRLPLDDALRITREVADALAYAHGQGVIHRDIKPENILLGGTHARVADFGIAKAIAVDGENGTATGIVIGTPAYMSPEQATSVAAVDGRSDVYSLGCVLFEMLTGQLPHAGPTPHAVLARRLVEPAASVSQLRHDVPAWVEAALQTALARDPADRYSSPTGLMRALGGWGDSTVAPAERRPRLRAMVAGGIGVLVLAAVVTAVLVRGGSDGPALTLGATRSLTYESGMEIDVALSPDGQTLAYAALDRDVNAMRIYVRELSGGNALAVSGEAPGWHRLPRWSPDGSQILFTALRVPNADGSRSSHLVVVPKMGGASRDLVMGAEWGTWSPDGAAIAYTRLLRGLFIQRIGGPERLLASSNTVPIHSPSWSPDGKWVVYVNGNHDYLRSQFGNLGPSELRLVSAEGGESWALTDYAHLHVSPTWLPDSRGLLMVSNRDGANDVHMLTLGSDGRARDLSRLTTDLGVGQVALSADAGHIAYVLVTANEANVWRLPIADRQVASLEQAEPVTTGTQYVETMSVSPDGSQLAYDSDRTGNADIYVVRMPDGVPVQVTHDAADEFYPVWSPDGAQLAFISWRSGNRDIFVMPSGTVGDATAVATSPGQDFRMTWAPDSRRMAYISNLTRPALAGYDLYVAEREDGGRWAVSPEPIVTGAWEPKWSPDGRAIAFFGEPGLTLRVVSPDGSGNRVLLPSTFAHGGRDYDLRPATAWTRDSLALYVRARVPSPGGGPSETVFFRMDLATGALDIIASLNDPDAPPDGGRDEFAADDRFLYVTRAKRQADIRLATLERR